MLYSWFVRLAVLLDAVRSMDENANIYRFDNNNHRWTQINTDKHKCFENYLNKSVFICVLYLCPSVVSYIRFFAGAISHSQKLIK